jgi:hypothetical protein
VFRPSPLASPLHAEAEGLTDLSAAAVLRRAPLAARFRLARKLAGLTLADISAALGVSISMVCRYERRPAIMSATVVARYAAAVGLPAALLTE